MAQIKYFDMHCDTLTVCADGGSDIENGALQTNVAKLKEGGCAAQCFAIFTQGEDAASCFEKYYSFYVGTVESGKFLPVHSGSDLLRCLDGDATGAILTVENLGFTRGEEDKLSRLSALGVKMASLVWNFENELAYPNVVYENGLKRTARERRGLKPKGREAVRLLDNQRIIVDLSHLSDGGAEEILCGRKIPVVASHSDAAAVLNVARNLTDGLIKKIADCGGVVGINFCADFLGGGDKFARVLAHIRHIVKTGGEDVVAFGGDFDGIPPVEGIEDCSKMPSLLNYLNMHKISGRLLEKLAYANFLRVFSEVCG